MADQTTMNEQMVESSPAEMNGSAPKRVAANFSELAGDVARLVELQAAMLKEDFRLSYRKLVRGIVLLAVGVAVALGTIPVLLASLAALLNMLFDIGWAASGAIAGAIGLIIAGIATYVGLSAARDSKPLTRSLREFKGNMVWLKEVLTRDRVRSA